jgi:hypothetical protein
MLKYAMADLSKDTIPGYLVDFGLTASGMGIASRLSKSCGTINNKPCRLCAQRLSATNGPGGNFCEARTADGKITSQEQIDILIAAFKARPRYDSRWK